MDSLIRALDGEFARLHDETLKVVDHISFDDLFRRPQSQNFTVRSGGELLLRSAAAIEQTFGGITANLWDDPFEWTQPETLTSREKILEYLNEVEATRKLGFDLFRTDVDLTKEIMSPAGKIVLMPLLLDTLVRAADYFGRAEATFELMKRLD